MTSEAFEKYEVSNKGLARKRIGLLILGIGIFIVLISVVAIISLNKQEESTDFKEQTDEMEEDFDPNMWDEDDYEDEDFDDEFNYWFTSINDLNKYEWC